MKKVLSTLALVALLGAPALAQQTGAVSGTVTLTDGTNVAGVRIEAAADVLPRPRVATSRANGTYSLPNLPPGSYTLIFSHDDFATVTRNVRVLLGQDATVDVALDSTTIEEEIDVVAETPFVDRSSAALDASITNETIEQLPVGEEYRDLVKLIPGVQYTEETVRGPSAGGSGQDNVYQFDGVSVGLPLFGVLSAEPSSHDIDQISVVKGGADAVGFNRAGGFTIDSVSKSGTGDFHGTVSYKVQTADMTEDQVGESLSVFDQDRDWALASLGGPILRDRLFFYGSYYRPTTDRDNRSNVYGSVPKFEGTRDEFFGKLTFTPTDSLLIHGSYRDSDRENRNAGVGGLSAASTSDGEDATLEIGILEGSWVVFDDSFVTFKYTDFANETLSRPDNLFNFPLRADGSLRLDVGNLDQQGLFEVPTPRAGEDAYNAFIDPLIRTYGFPRDGALTGGGLVGGASTINEQDFFRESYQVGYDWFFGDAVSHDLHIGYQWSRDEEDLSRTSNGWGFITAPGGRIETSGGEPIFYQAEFWQQSLVDDTGALVPVIHSEFESQSIEINDIIRWRDFTFNVGVLLSNDELYGQGLKANSANKSGFELAVNSQYKMYEIDFEDQIQPRLGAVWAYDDEGTVFANYSRYYPAASSLPRAASWARNLRQILRASFDADGNLLEVEPVESSSGKFFQANMNPRSTDEFLVGTSRQLNRAWSGRAHVRYRYSHDFWEDTNNDARQRFEPPPGIPQELYIDNLNEVRGEIGGSSYVIAELDNAFTKYWEASFDVERRGRRSMVRASYVWSHYYGNFDQDNTSTVNDQAIFIGSSNLADGAGRQLWDFKYGNLRGDRRHQLKAFGFYRLPWWSGTVGAFGVYQSGQPWETWDSEVYRHLTSSTSDTIRFAEPAGSRRSDDHYQVDLNYTHDFRLVGRYGLELAVDLFNVTDNQTGYNIEPRRSSSIYGQPRSFYAPRRYQVSLRFEF